MDYKNIEESTVIYFKKTPKSVLLVITRCDLNSTTDNKSVVSFCQTPYVALSNNNLAVSDLNVAL